MEANQKKRFVCKFCNKRYPCGKSLGGHIRIHLNVSSTDATEEANNQSNHVNHQSQGLVGDDDGSNSSKREFSGPSGEALVAGQTSYGLRENPKKTKRFLFDLSNSNLLQDKVCKECGKGFQSLKALCGHMACHSRNNNNNNNNHHHHQNMEDHYSVTSEKLKELVMDDQSDTETSAPTKRRRSERVKYKARCVYTSSGNSLSTGSDVEQEQEEVAMCLMLLSKDSSFKGCFSSIGDSSDNTSVVLETKSSSAKSRRVGGKNVGAHHEFEDNLYLLMKKSKQQEEEESMENENDELENSDSGYFRNGPRKVEFDPYSDGVGRNDELMNGKAELGSGFCGRFDSEMGKRLSRFRRIKAELRKNMIEADGNGRKNDFYNPELQKRGRTPGLGEQKVSQKKTNGLIYYSKNGGIDNGGDTNYVPASSKNIQPSTRKNPVQQSFSSKADKKLGTRKGKMHECPFCSKVFRSGQALGGHKRSHFVGSAEDRTVVIKEDVPNITIPTLIDLNLPAPPEEEVAGFTPW